MKKIMSFFICFILFLYGGNAKAAQVPSLSVDVKGNIEIGQTIKILINVDNIDTLYAGAATIKYNPKVLKIISFEKGDLIAKSGTSIFDVENKIDNTNGIASFGGFTCLGQVDGFSGTGTFLKINAEILKKDNFNINSQPFLSSPNDNYNLKIQLCDKNIEEVSYQFKAYEFKATIGTPAIADNKDGASVINSDIDSNAGVSTESSANTKSKIKQEEIVVNSDTNTKAQTSIEVPVNNESENEQDKVMVNLDTKGDTKNTTDSLLIKENEIKKSVLASNSKTSNNANGVINKIKTDSPEKIESSNKTKKNTGWQQGILISCTILLAFAVMSRIIFYRKKIIR
ncbi:MAG: cohesin domain-containing protein [Clostridium sp.]|uniref:cohesin domain-containing protein n=1 Tax=Clostridium sp. TaxID=1506 RepID=UPI003D6CEE77